MNSQKIGNLIQALRQEKNLTQKEVADALFVSAKTVSKWECGNGCPDITLLPALSRFFSVDIDQLLSGCLEKDTKTGGNMKRLKFYICPECSNIITSTGSATISCCGRTLEPCQEQECSDKNSSLLPKIIPLDDELCVSFNHEMTKQNYIRFVAWLNFDTLILKKLYPEQEAQVIFPKVHHGTWYVCSSKEGLFKIK